MLRADGAVRRLRGKLLLRNLRGESGELYRPEKLGRAHPCSAQGQRCTEQFKKNYPKGLQWPGALPSKIQTEKVRYANFAQPVDGTVSHSIRINLRVGNDSLTTKLRGG